MPEFVFNDSEPRKVLEPGDYVAQVTGYKFDKSQGSGNLYLALELAIEPSGNKVFDNLVFTEKAWWKIDTCLKSLGFKLVKGTKYNIDEAFAQQLIGKRGWTTLAKQAAEGKWPEKNKVAVWITNKALPIPTTTREDVTPFG